MVAPERDTPGIIDSTWKRPMPSARGSGSCMASWNFAGGLQRSSAISTTPPTISDQQMMAGLSNRNSLMKSCRARPSTTAGMKATSTLSTKRRAWGSLGMRSATAHSRWK